MRNRLNFRSDSSDYSPLSGPHENHDLQVKDLSDALPEVSMSQLEESIPVAGGVLSAELALDLVLNQIAEQARLATASSGVAIALMRSENLVCRATTGSAPDLGMRLDPDAGLSGLAMQNRMPQHCADAENDSRVDSAACRNLRVRSILVVPVLKEKEIAGIIEAFAADPYHFREHDIETLRSFCRQIVERIDHAAATAAPKTQEEKQPAAVVPQSPQESTQESPPERSSSWDGWTLFLSMCVIIAASLLGWLIGRSERRSEKRKATASQAQLAVPIAADTNVSKTPVPVVVGENVKEQRSVPVTKSREKKVAPEKQSDGGLVVSQNGKVVFRERPRTAPAIPNHSGGAPAASKTQFVTAGAVNQYLSYRVEPQYPESARQQKTQGPVVLKVMVAADGGVQQVQVVSGDPALAAAAAKAVVQWKFKPLSRMGQPVEFETQVTVDFKLP